MKLVNILLIEGRKEDLENKEKYFRRKKE